MLIFTATLEVEVHYMRSYEHGRRREAIITDALVYNKKNKGPSFDAVCVKSSVMCQESPIIPYA